VKSSILATGAPGFSSASAAITDASAASLWQGGSHRNGIQSLISSLVSDESSKVCWLLGGEKGKWIEEKPELEGEECDYGEKPCVAVWEASCEASANDTRSDSKRQVAAKFRRHALRHMLCLFVAIPFASRHLST